MNQIQNDNSELSRSMEIYQAYCDLHPEGYPKNLNRLAPGYQEGFDKFHRIGNAVANLLDHLTKAFNANEINPRDLKNSCMELYSKMDGYQRLLGVEICTYEQICNFVSESTLLKNYMF